MYIFPDSEMITIKWTLVHWIVDMAQLTDFKDLNKKINEIIHHYLARAYQDC